MSVRESLFQLTERTGVHRLVAATPWRRRRLLVLCYHGVSMQDEHLWNPALFVPPSLLRSRLAFLRRRGYAILPFAEAVERVYAGTLPAKAVTITFDDGFRDFAVEALPALQEFDAPATLYLTTYYCDNLLPVFNPALGYLLWKARGRSVNLTDFGAGVATLTTPADRSRACAAVATRTANAGMNGPERHAVLRDIAARLGVDFDAFVASGVLQNMTPEQLHALPRDLVDIQLHTHRHRTPRDEALFRREIVENRERIPVLTGRPGALQHFCYPSGDYAGRFLPWLESLGVTTATTAVPALVTRRDHPLLLPRVFDVTDTAEATFSAWLSGFADLLPKRRRHRTDRNRA